MRSVFYLIKSKQIPNQYQILYKNQAMGDAQSKSTCQKLIGLVDDHKASYFSEKLFVSELFKPIDQNNTHSEGGPIIVVDTYVLKQFYNLLADYVPNVQVKATRIKESIQKIYSKPDKCIQYSYKIIQHDLEQPIAYAQFEAYIIQCYEWSVGSALKSSEFDEGFRKNFRSWVDANKHLLVSSIKSIFDKYAQTDKSKWFYGDFIRWVKDGQHWTLNMEIRSKKFRIPLNLPCIFAVRFD